MKRFLLGLAFVVAPLTARAQLITCLNGVGACGTFTTTLSSDLTGATALYSGGGGFPLYLQGSIPFTFVSAVFQSQAALNDMIQVRAYTADQLDPRFFPFILGSGPTPAYDAFFVSQPGAPVARTFNFSGVSAIGFDDSGGINVNDPMHTTTTGYFVTQIVVSVAPEPATVVLLATGLLVMGAFARRRSRGRTIAA